MLLSIIIPVYGQADLTKNCLKALDATLEPGILQDLEILVVDNGATLPTCGQDGVASLGQELFGPSFTWLGQSHNLNFAGGCNLGAEKAQGQYLFFLNNDTLPQPGWLPPLLQAFQQQESIRPQSSLGALGACGPLLLYPPKNESTATIQHLGVCLSPQLRLSHLYEHFPQDHPVASKAHRPLQAITAAALMVPAQVFRQVGGFCEDFRNGFEDVDFCMRLGQAGYGLACIPQSHIWHLCGQSQGRLDNEAHNRQVLHQRGAMAYFHPDEHLLLAQDGYKLIPTPWMSWQTELAPQQAVALAKKAHQVADSPTHAQATIYQLLLNQEPFWHQGRRDFLSCLRQIARSGQAHHWQRLLDESLVALNFDTTPWPLLFVLEAAQALALSDMAQSTLVEINKHVLSQNDRIESLRKWRQNIRLTSPSLVPDLDNLLSQEHSFLVGEYAEFRVSLMALTIPLASKL